MAAEAFIRAADGLADWIRQTPNPETYHRTAKALERCREAVQEDFGLDMPMQHRKVKRTLREMNLLRQVRYHKRLRMSLEKKLKVTKGHHLGGMVAPEIFVKVGITDPAVNSRQLKKMLSTDCQAAISHVYAGKVRDSFAEILKDLTKERLSSAIGSAPLDGRGAVACAVYVAHIHDEAIMRFRSYDRVAVEAFGSDGQGPVFSRGRYSKVQNTSLHITLGSSLKSMEWYSELQALSRKDACTLATALMLTVDEVLRVCKKAVQDRGARRAKIIHLMVGDGIPTNEAAAKRLLHQYSIKKAWGPEVQYRLLVWKCASHQSNLVVLVAIAGRMVADAVEQDDLCGRWMDVRGCVKFFPTVVIGRQTGHPYFAFLFLSW